MHFSEMAVVPLELTCDYYVVLSFLGACGLLCYSQIVDLLIFSGYVDSDYANSKERKSTIGFCFFL